MRDVVVTNGSAVTVVDSVVVFSSGPRVVLSDVWVVG